MLNHNPLCTVRYSATPSVLETKGNITMDALRPTEREKIECGKAHFAALGDGATFLPVDDFGEFMQGI